MDVIDVRAFESDFVIYFGAEPKRINAYTLASSLVSIADAVKAANSLINPGYDVEVVVEALAEGSFKAKVRTLYTGASNIFSTENLKAITLGVIAAYVYQHSLSSDQAVNVFVKTDEVIVEQRNKRIVIPRDVYDSVKEVEKSERFTQSIGKAFEALERDADIESIGFTRGLDDEIPPILIPRSRFALLSDSPEIQENQREVLDVATLHILRAILERGKRKWEFVWRGIKISAPVLDERFFDDFFAHKIMIAPGDSIEVKLKIYQSRDPDTRIFTNNRYEVIEVLRHIPTPKQLGMDG